MKASSVAHSNIALVKYWGKRDESLILPYNGSVSMTLDALITETTVEFNDKYDRDIVTIDDRPVYGKDYEEYSKKFLDLVRRLSKTHLFAKVVSRNNFPTSVGLASSASGFASLAFACNKALDMGLEGKELTILARQGSGSACRSIYGGFSEWLKGKKRDGSDSYAIQLHDENFWPQLRMIACITDTSEKKVKSRAGMKNTVLTSSFYNSWIKSADEDLSSAITAVKRKDLDSLGKIAEMNCLRMHATMITSDPPILYWNEKTIGIMQRIREMRENGIKCYFTMDAGPQVKVLCLEPDALRIANELKRLCYDMVICGPGKGAEELTKHLF